MFVYGCGRVYTCVCVCCTLGFSSSCIQIYTHLCLPVFILVKVDNSLRFDVMFFSSTSLVVFKTYNAIRRAYLYTHAYAYYTRHTYTV